ncbi:MAG: hypothetical protein GEV10_13040 [Streptosporangiales bacterium]|nr:hypothetical protein [Streptosporangiales bacterium]
MSCPASADLVGWGNAWLLGHCGLDEVVDALERTHGAQVVTAGATAAETPLRQVLGDLRGRGLAAFRLALPAPGDPLGLAGPADFNASAIEAGEAVLVELRDDATGLVPTADARGSSYTGLRWTRHRLTRATGATPTLAEAEQHLALTLRDAADALLDLDVATWNPGAAATLAGIRRGGSDRLTLAPGYPPRALRVAAQAARLAAISAVGLADDGGAVSTWEADARRSALRDLERAVRRARVAAYNSVTEHGAE